MKKTILAMMCMSLLLGTGIAAADITTGLIAYYPFTGNSSDIAGANNGTVYGTTFLTADRFGRPNRAYHFDGTDSHIELDHNFDFVSMGGNLTFSAWVKYEGGGYIFYQGSGGEIYLSISDGYASFVAHLTDDWYEARATDLMPQNQWVHVTGVYYGQQKIELWVNGNLITSTDLSNNNLFNPTWNTFYANIGAYHEAGHGLVSPFQGTIYEVRIFNRALTQADIQQLVALGTPVTATLSLLLLD